MCRELNNIEKYIAGNNNIQKPFAEKLLLVQVIYQEIITPKKGNIQEDEDNAPNSRRVYILIKPKFAMVNNQEVQNRPQAQIRIAQKTRQRGFHLT